MTDLYKHQKEGIEFLVARSAAGLFWEMGLGKTRAALVAAYQLFGINKIDRVLVLAPAAVRYSWEEEIGKLLVSGMRLNLVSYYPSNQSFYAVPPNLDGMPICVTSYSLLPQERHAKTLREWCLGGDTLLVCDESSFLKNRTAKQTRAAMNIGTACQYRWLLTGTPVANSPLDLWGQGIVMASGAKGPLAGFKNWYHFRYRYGVLGGFKGKQVVAYQNVEELTERFAPYVLRREKKECLDLPAKTYIVREVALKEDTWKIYKELKRDALLALGDGETRPEPNATVRLLRLCQLTSGHVGLQTGEEVMYEAGFTGSVKDVSDEKLSWLDHEIADGELSNERRLIVWCRWRRERERLAQLLFDRHEYVVMQIYGGQRPLDRETALATFGTTSAREVFLAQPHAGGFGLNLIAASTAVYLSNDFSYTTRIQSEDRTHRIGQYHSCTYIDVIATGPNGQRTVDSHVLSCLRTKKDLAEMTCNAWRRVLEVE